MPVHLPDTDTAWRGGRGGLSHSLAFIYPMASGEMSQPRKEAGCGVWESWEHSKAVQAGADSLEMAESSQGNEAEIWTWLFPGEKDFPV